MSTTPPRLFVAINAADCPLGYPQPKGFIKIGPTLIEARHLREALQCAYLGLSTVRPPAVPKLTLTPEKPAA